MKYRSRDMTVCSEEKSLCAAYGLPKKKKKNVKKYEAMVKT